MNRQGIGKVHLLQIGNYSWEGDTAGAVSGGTTVEMSVAMVDGAAQHCHRCEFLKIMTYITNIMLMLCSPENFSLSIYHGKKSTIETLTCCAAVVLLCLV